MLKRNILANVLGGSWTALVSVLLIPVQVHFLGVQAYGLLAFVASIQVLFSIFDFGLSPTITREVAKDKSTGAVHTLGLVRSLSLIYWPIGFALGAALFGASDWVAMHWLHVGTLTPDRAATAIRLAAIAIALRWPVSLYGGVLAGRQRFDVLNGLRAGVATVNAVGGAAILVMTGDLIAYMGWTAVAAAVETSAYSSMVVRLLPGLLIRPKPRPPFERQMGSFARGMTLINLLTMVLTQSDRLLISKLLAIQVLGYYALAYNVLYGLTLIQNFVTSAMFPAFVMSAAGNAANELRERYGKATQVLMYAYNLPIWLLVFFGRDILARVTSAETANNVAPVLSILSVGFLLNACAALAYTASIATGNTSIPIRVNLVAATIYIPVLAILTIEFAGVGTALAWLLVNLFYLPTFIRIVHRDVVKTPNTTWLARDFLPFVAAAVVCLGAARSVASLGGGGTAVSVEAAALGVATYSILGFALLRPAVRTEIGDSLRGLRPAWSRGPSRHQ